MCTISLIEHGDHAILFGQTMPGRERGNYLEIHILLNTQWFVVTVLKTVGPLLLVSVLTIGCASVPDIKTAAAHQSTSTAGGKSRAERVFLYQSRVANAYLDRYSLIEIYGHVDPSVMEAETRMMESCSPLTQAVLTHVEGVEPSLGLRVRVLSTIDECERAARQMDQLLNQATLADSI